MTVSQSAIPDQSDFGECYRDRQGALCHLSYMRMAKVLLLLRLCRESGIDLRGKRIFDYGFGAGTFFRYCPRTSRLAGVEIDPENVRAVRNMLAQRGVKAYLEPIQIDNWAEHPLLERQYDIIVASHVLEHLPDPISFLKRIADSLALEGLFLGLVPLNERKTDPHHVQSVDRTKVFQWAEASGMQVQDYLETDPWLYWIQPIFSMKGKVGRLIAQGVGLAVGAVATMFGPRVWFGALTESFAAITKSRPTQAAFVLRRIRLRDDSQ